ncbi:MAG: 2-C-methyl-D-erythritol 2,4-cyclodiphosphate synthase [bacterium]
MRIGMGYDVHPLVEGRKLIIGGVEIPFERGLLGHSDADVLLHAVCDAILGAAGMRDIGYHFPDTDERYRGISSMIILEETHRMIEGRFKVNNIDAVIVAQKPKMSPYIEDMRRNISQCLGIPADRVNVKATTTEGLGFPGRGEGMASYAVVSLTEIS